MRSRVLGAALAVTMGLAAACGEETTAEPPAGTEPADTPLESDERRLEIEAEDFSFNVDTVSVPAGARVTLELRNRDSVAHSFSVYTTDRADEAIFRSDPLTGPGENIFEFHAPPEPGTYWFRCDIHPEEMNGDFVVE